MVIGATLQGLASNQASTESAHRVTLSRDVYFSEPEPGLRSVMKVRSLIVAGVFAAMLLADAAAFAQSPLSGNWLPMRSHEDDMDRGPGPDLGDYTGLPINDAARVFAESWDASRLTLQEHQCRVHVAPYIYHGPLNLRIWEEKDPDRKSTRLNSSHSQISYAVFCLK